MSMTPTSFIILMLSFMVVALIKIWFGDNKKEQDMGKSSELYTQKIEKLQDDYGALKINKDQFEQGLNDLGITCVEEVAIYLDDAENARYEFKLDPSVEPTTTVDDIAMPFPEVQIVPVGTYADDIHESKKKK